MTCYLRMHEVLVGVDHPNQKPEWDTVIEEWQKATSVEDRNRALAEMAVEPIDIYDLPRVDLGRFNGLILSGRVDQEFLYRQRASIRAFLDTGKALIFSGQLFRPWVPGGDAFVPKASVSENGDTAPSIGKHPIFEGVREEDLGRSFVYSHGHHPPPEGAEALVTLSSGEPAMYVDRASTGGTILLHGGHNLLGYSGTGPTARRVVPQLLDWIYREGSRS